MPQVKSEHLMRGIRLLGLKCDGVVDKYVEYDPAIVMIDLVLVSTEAQRHLIYNIEFESYWKLFIILIMLETYGHWRSDSLFTIGVNTFCAIQKSETNITQLSRPANTTVQESWACSGWNPVTRTDDNDLFIWEKDFYIQFLSTFISVVVFIVTVHSSMTLLNNINNKVTVSKVLKSFSLAYTSTLFTLSMLVWSNAETSVQTRTLHYLLVFTYSFVVFCNVFSVLYESPAPVTTVVLVAAHGGKYFTAFHLTPFIRELIS